MKKEYAVKSLPDLAALQALVTVAEVGSLTAASSRLGVTQQAVSLRIRALENAVGSVLLLRSPRGSTLNATGELVASWAGVLLEATDSFVTAIETLRSEHARSLRIAASLTIAEHLLPEWIARWNAQRENDSGQIVQLVAANSSAVADLVRRGETDIGFIETPQIPSDLESTMMARDEIVIVAPTGHPWTTKSVSAQEVAETPLVLREPGSGTRQALERALQEAGHPLNADPAAVLSTTLGIRSTIAAGTAPGALSTLAVREDVKRGRLHVVSVQDMRILRPLTIVWAGQRPPQSARGLIEALSYFVSEPMHS